MQLARPHKHLSNRAKVRAALDRKPVFKSVLENPFRLSWPSVAVDVQNVALARVVTALDTVSLRTQTCRKHPQQTGISGQRGNAEGVNQAPRMSSASLHLVVGINAVTRALEYQLHAARNLVIALPNHDEPPPPPQTLSPIAVVFVCCADVDPSALIDHLLHLVAGCNSPKNVAQPIRLTPLPKGSEPTISQALGVRRAAVLAFRHGSPLSETVRDILDSVPIVRAPWLCPTNIHDSTQLVPTHIKQVRTTAPRDMKSAREQRSEARAAATRSSRSARRKTRITLTTESAIHVG